MVEAQCKSIILVTLCQSRMLIECAFGRLKARFGALKRATDINVDEIASIIYACFELHNFCELNNETSSEDKISSAIDYDRPFPPVQPAINYWTDSNETVAKKIRTLTEYFDPWICSWKWWGVNIWSDSGHVECLLHDCVVKLHV